MHQKDEPCNTIGINRAVSVIVLGPQYKLQGRFLFESLLTGIHLWLSHCTPVNMTEDVIEQYNIFNTKGFLEDRISGNLNNQSIPSTYCFLINDYDNDGTLIDADLAENEGVENGVVKNMRKPMTKYLLKVTTTLLQTLTTPPKSLEIEGVDEVYNETEER